MASPFSVPPSDRESNESKTTASTPELLTPTSTTRTFFSPTTTTSKATSKRVAPPINWLQTPMLKWVIYCCSIATCFIMFMVLYNVVHVYLDPVGRWTMYVPQNADFHHISISSSSETCSELAREFAIRDFSVPSISYFLTSCLLLAEPQSSGFGGSSVFVYGDAKTKRCLHGAGYVRYVVNLNAFREALAIDPSSEHVGPYSIATPLDLLTLAGLYDTAVNENASLEHFSSITWTLNNDFVEEKMRMPVSKTLSMALKSGGLNIEIVTNEKMSHLTDGVGSVLTEGKLFEPSKIALKFVTALVEHKGSRKRAFYPKTETEHSRIWKDTILQIASMTAESHGGGITEREFYFYAINGSKTRIVDKLLSEILTTEFGNFSFCAVQAFANTSVSFVPDALKKFNKSILDAEQAPEISSGFYINVYKSMLDIFDVARRTMSRSLSSKKTGNAKRMVELKKLDSLHRIPPFNQYSSNQFAVVDHRSQIAVSLIGTLGSSFGSHIFGSGGAIIMNNLMSQAGKNLDEAGDHHNDLEPVIVFNGDKIHTAYAGSGGFMTRSLDIPRRLSSLALSLFYGRKLEESLSIPLYVPLPGNVNYQGPGMPWFVLNRLRAMFGRTPKQSNEVDKVAAIQGKRALYFDGSKHRASIMPNGY